MGGLRKPVHIKRRWSLCAAQTVFSMARKEGRCATSVEAHGGLSDLSDHPLVGLVKPFDCCPDRVGAVGAERKPAQLDGDVMRAPIECGRVQGVSHWRWQYGICSSLRRCQLRRWRASRVFGAAHCVVLIGNFRFVKLALRLTACGLCVTACG